ncbi:peptide ABC transporter substrate-binding protein [Weissella confusa]|uniref:peptide ABC transporter substrate-binding protein n=1 Tax=Weissella confusa TaxID=1583 RepID=UPI00223AF270|nr:peptide ABC transporter substrate-binding protein [Weissella confusa]MCT0025955.1 peptide ABC transporter substrate-binding protein [Weissella confusa]
MNKFVKNSVLMSATLVMVAGTGLPVVSASEAKAINWTLTGDLKTTDPSNVADIPSQDAVMATGEGLYRVGKSGQPELAAAQSAEVSQDGLTWTFKLRDNLKWSDGSKLTAQDFVYSWQRTNDPKTAAIGAMFFSGVKNADAIQAGKVTDLNELGAKALDDTTLQVTLERPLPQFKAELAMMYFFPEKQSFVEQTGQKFGTTAVDSLSSGPYVLKKWDGSSSSYTYEKNPNYWDAANVKTPAVNVTTTADATTSFNLYNSGKTDFALLNATQARNSKNKPGYTVVDTAATTYMTMNQKNKALQNVKVRQALSFAVNREKLAKNVLTGAAEPAKTFTAKGLAKYPNTDKDFTVGAHTKYVSYDKAQAAKLWQQGLKQVGQKQVKLTLLTNDTDAAKQTGQYLQSQLETNLKGLTVSVKSVPAKQTSSLQKAGKFDLSLATWNADYTDPVDMLQTLVTGASWNLTGWSDKKYDALYDKATTTDANDEKARFKDLAAAEEYAQKQGAVAPLTYSKMTALMNPKVKGVFVNPVGGTFDWKNAVKN